MDLDRYYTPRDIASEVVAAGTALLPKPRVVADTACGAGHLLLAAQEALGGVKCIGIDTDRNAIRRLRAKNPAWLLSVADVLDVTVLSRVRAVVDAPGCDLLTLNPPFSISKNKTVDASFAGHRLRSSIAMAHILRSLDTFTPGGGAVAIVPESLLFSDVDKEARLLLARHYDTQALRGLSNSTFRGARANALIVQWVPKRARNAPTGEAIAPEVRLRDPKVIRGGLPLFEAVKSRNGLPLIHSTSITKLIETRSVSHCLKVKSINRGVVKGTMLLLPRVGVPLREYVHVVNLRDAVQLSDCVFAIQFSSARKAEAFRCQILLDWAALLSQYHGTGARYISVARMTQWAHAVATMSAVL